MSGSSGERYAPPFEQDLDDDRTPDAGATAMTTGSQSSGGGGGGTVRFMAMPQLMGAPAYARPPRIVEETPRPLDPDDLPIAAMRSPEDEALLSGVYELTNVEPEPTLQPSSQGGLRGIASRLFGSGR